MSPRVFAKKKGTLIKEAKLSIKPLPEHVVGRCVFSLCAFNDVCCRSFVIFKVFRASRDSQATFATRNCIVVCCRVATPFCDMFEPREPQTPRTCWPSNLDSSLWSCVLLADSSSRSLFGVSSAGQCREEHPSTGCHGDDDSSEGVDESWVASVRSNREGPAYTAMCLP